MQLAYRIVNVFTHNRGRLTGNPLCVFEDGAALDAATMQALARQINLSETTFILPTTGATARVRVFTPDFELPFAGHPTLGTAHVCRALGLGGDSQLLEMLAGRIAVTADGDCWRLRAAPASHREVEISFAELASLLGLGEADIDQRPLWVKAGKEQLVVPLTSERAVRSVKPSPQLLQRLVSEDGQGMVYVFAEIGPGKVLARFSIPSGESVIEDPATGSATANLGGWMLAMAKPVPQKLEISQGEYVARPSTLSLEIDADRQIFVAGDVVELAVGRFEI